MLRSSTEQEFKYPNYLSSGRMAQGSSTAVISDKDLCFQNGLFSIAARFYGKAVNRVEKKVIA